MKQVDLTKLPRSKQFRPDFMATGPHAVILKDKPVTFSAPTNSHDDDDEEEHQYKYYESEKILGKLFRAIDERQVLSSVQSSSHVGNTAFTGGAQSVLRSVWAWAQHRCQMLQWQRHVPRAYGILDEYARNCYFQ